MLSTELIIDLFFMADIVLNFNTGYIIEQACLLSSVARACAQATVKQEHH